MTNEAAVRTVKDWNRFVYSLTRARELWDKMQRALDEDPVHGDLLPPKLQKVLSMHRRMQFTLAIVEFAEYWRAYGGLDSFFIDIPEDEVLREKYKKLMEKIRKGNGNG